MIKRFFSSKLLPETEKITPKQKEKIETKKNFLFFGQWEKILLAVCLGLFFVSSALFFRFFVYPSNSTIILRPENSFKTTAPAFVFFSKLTGLGVNDESAVAPRLAAVMIDNNPDAYPLFGLNDSGVVYEAPVEGGITRFMAIYTADSMAEKVGPVRSARPYFLDWALEYGDILYMHCGGSQDGLSAVKETRIFDANEFYRAPYFWRTIDRLAPHNLFTSAELWQKYFIDYGSQRTKEEWQGWIFGENTSPSEKVGSFELEYAKSFDIGWRYNAESGKYERLLNGELFLDNQDNAITADNVIVQFASVKILDAVGRRAIGTVGTGEARVFHNGEMIRAEWKKAGEKERTRFFDENNNEILLTPGRTWVMVAPLNAVLTVGN